MKEKIAYDIRLTGQFGNEISVVKVKVFLTKKDANIAADKAYKKLIESGKHYKLKLLK